MIQNPQDPSLNFIEEGEQTSTNSQRQKQQTQEQQNYQHVYLQELYKQFRFIKDDFYFKDQPDQIAFKDKGQRIVSSSNDDRVTQAMVTLAQAKGWQSIKVSGHLEFQRKIWLEASQQGLEVQGYKPTEQDLYELQKSRGIKSKNIVEKVPHPANDTVKNKDKEFASSQQSTVKKEADIDEKTSKPSQHHQDKATTTSSEKTGQTQERIYKGRFVDHGGAKYNHDDNENDSHYIQLATKYGEKTIWGVDLSRAIEEGGVKPGDNITLKFKGAEDVTVEVPIRDKTGKITGSEWIDTLRNTWEVKKSDEAKIVEAVAATFIDRNVKDPQQREILKEAIENRLSEQQKVGTVPHVNVYDKTAHSKESEHVQTRPDPQHHLEHTR